MDRLASPVGGLRPAYDVVVVGSGYGGSVMAHRLAGDGRTVCLLERGEERHPGEYPETLVDILRQVQVTTSRRHLGRPGALFDLRVGGPMNVLVGCGLGGTSQINAGVALEMPPFVLDRRWPSAIVQGGLAELRPFYERAARMLGATPYPGPPLHKARALGRCAAALGTTSQPAPVNVTFTDRRNPAGIDQPACTSCGNCITGCNVGAKNTLVMNYLPAARDAGADVFVGIPVRSVQPDGSGGWLVHVVVPGYHRLGRGPRRGVVRARQVVLAAGTLGSTEILLRSRQAGLPLSDHLGRDVSGNGDILAVAFDGREVVNAIGTGPRTPADTPIGPTIVGKIDLTAIEVGNHRLMIEDASVPPALGRAIPPLLAALSLRHHPMRALAALASPWTGALRRTLPLCVMSPEHRGCDLTLDGEFLRLDGSDRAAGGDGPLLYPRHDKQLARAARGLGAALVHLPRSMPVLGSPLTTVHPLGGCAMADRAEAGVVNDACEVFSGPTGDDVHDGLLVVDGSVVPAPVVANPLLTICALAERAAQLLTESR
jgi:cholesterol oxidase